MDGAGRGLACLPAGSLMVSWAQCSVPFWAILRSLPWGPADGSRGTALPLPGPWAALDTGLTRRTDGPPHSPSIAFSAARAEREARRSCCSIRMGGEESPERRWGWGGDLLRCHLTPSNPNTQTLSPLQGLFSGPLHTPHGHFKPGLTVIP